MVQQEQDSCLGRAGRAERALCVQGADSSLAACEEHRKHKDKLCAVVPAGAEPGHGDPRAPFQPVFNPSVPVTIPAAVTCPVCTAVVKTQSFHRATLGHFVGLHTNSFFILGLL